MSLGIQEAVIAVIVTGSILFLILRFIRRRKSKSACSACRMMNKTPLAQKKSDS